MANKSPIATRNVNKELDPLLTKGKGIPLVGRSPMTTKILNRD
jgi:hypothetical protein